MAACQTIALTSLANAWLSLSTLVCGKKQDDEIRRATMLLKHSILATCTTEEELQEDLRSLASRVKTMKSALMKPELNTLLRQSRSKRQRLGQTTKKREALEQHMDTLHSSQLNQQVMSSVRQTTDALKSMGLEKQLENIDEVMMDLTECHTDMAAIQNGLSTSLSSECVEDDELEAEMNILLASDSDRVLTVPAGPNSMHPVNEAPPSSQLEPEKKLVPVSPAVTQAHVVPESYLEALTLSTPMSEESGILPA